MASDSELTFANVYQGEELAKFTSSSPKPSLRSATKERGDKSIANEQPVPLTSTSAQNKSAARFMSFLKEIENRTIKRVIGGDLAQSLFFIAKLNHI
ncbi:hypothetical protein EIB96_15550 [Vibrio parahaemolyticus]|uniref:hypothetical protein n=1 Tax=Vibrio parahaemolyticus TaxID=670 RepID=UPI0004F2A96C|nr:hypothetical protein [Vibrio parahaemolyticus]RFD43018.1 hypothetical protein H328_003970 [Vibrio parahaemolyticus 3355]EGR0924032.1 hypothetical protein [Vibrio parahaemolyticus]EGR0984893.1 hypothetical protein [Vibrio parahaemolyticus]EGR1372144.1 hypothetical protein [Vibrio parahaemolyticus]EGR1948183.1 hypothetical protein [Vibrio parahaemolyticus]